MTEEIIIDGVNVTGCEYFAKQNEHSCLEENGNCKNISDCYYKQLIRLEQENKELKAYKDVNEDFKKAWDELNEKYKQLRSALEEIREKIKSLNKDICNNCGWYNTDNCQPNGYVCHDLIEIKNKINECLGE